LLVLYSDCTCTVPEPYLLRTNSVVSPYRGTSDRRRYGASTARIRLGYGSFDEYFHGDSVQMPNGNFVVQ